MSVSRQRPRSDSDSSSSSFTGSSYSGDSDGPGLSSGESGEDSDASEDSASLQSSASSSSESSFNIQGGGSDSESDSESDSDSEISTSASEASSDEEEEEEEEETNADLVGGARRRRPRQPRLRLNKSAHLSREVEKLKASLRECEMNLPKKRRKTRPQNFVTEYMLDDFRNAYYDDLTPSEQLEFEKALRQDVDNHKVQIRDFAGRDDASSPAKRRPQPLQGTGATPLSGMSFAPPAPAARPPAPAARPLVPAPAPAARPPAPDFLKPAARTPMTNPAHAPLMHSSGFPRAGAAGAHRTLHGARPTPAAQQSARPTYRW